MSVRLELHGILNAALFVSERPLIGYSVHGFFFSIDQKRKCKSKRKQNLLIFYWRVKTKKKLKKTERVKYKDNH